MEARRRSSAPVLPLAFFLPSSHSPTRHSNSPSSSSAFNFAVHRILSPTRATFTGDSSYFSSASAAASSYISFSFDGSASQVRSSGLPISPNGGATKKACMCSPTNHPGSFRCSLHKNSNNSPSSTQSHLNARRSTMTNSLIRIGGVEGEWVRRALTSLIRPSTHRTQRRSFSQPRPSRLCHVTTNPDLR
jgi:hypothetical protein